MNFRVLKPFEMQAQNRIPFSYNQTVAGVLKAERTAYEKGNVSEKAGDMG